ncbi:WYL domain-containing protein [Frankia sp. Cas3]|uniref:helix-turn-helix transcriptional regulator n=1 Tax=Frankia sp. Cas3 TaxID=3073926 RepID=UPI002AD44134|nr:WYL domain-containing protein [Frankia sp. Cas3]
MNTPTNASTASTTDRLSRLLALVPWLRAHPGVSLGEAAATFGITVRQLRDDLDLLFVCGVPGGAPGDLIDLSYSADGVTVLDPQTLDRPLRLSADEAMALVVAARTLAEVPGLAARDALDRAVAKLEKAVGALPADRVRVELDAQDEVLRVVQDAVTRKRRLHLRYLVWSRDEMTERDVDPMRVLARDGRWYLEGWCHRSKAVRIFRLDRIDGSHGVTVLDIPAAPPPEATPRESAESLYQPGPYDRRAVLRLHPGARWVADYYPVESQRELDAGYLLVELRVSETGWLRRLVLGLGDQARLVEPAELATEIHDVAVRALAAYGIRPRPTAE